MGMQYKNLIAGEWVATADSVANINPSDLTDVIGNFATANTAETESAISAAYDAFPSWSRTHILTRYEILKSVGDQILARKDELGLLLSREQGKTLTEGNAEVVRAGQIFHYYAAETLRLAGEKQSAIRPNIEVEITREPLGVVGLITPWNFPMSIPAWKIAPALAYGNTVVFKPAELVPASAHVLAEIIQKAGAPAGVFNLVMGKGSVVGTAILNSPKVAGVSFTGSVPTGRIIAQSCVTSSPMKKVQLEMGGKNPLVILDDTDLDVAVEATINGSFFATGQRCTASERLIVTEGIHDRFVAAVIERMNSLKIDHALKPGTEIGPVVDSKQLEQDLSYIDIGRSEGGKLVSGGLPLKRDTNGFYLAPALFTEVDNSMRIAREEIFGPVAGVIRVRNYEEALAVANDTEFGLSSGICTTSLKHANHFKRNTQSGMTMVNLPTSGVEFHVAFGGRKASSYGPREQGRYAAEFYTTVKTAYVFDGNVVPN